VFLIADQVAVVIETLLLLLLLLLVMLLLLLLLLSNFSFFKFDRNETFFVSNFGMTFEKQNGEKEEDGGQDVC
jgi:hypothetical protein